MPSVYFNDAQELQATLPTTAWTTAQGTTIVAFSVDNDTSYGTVTPLNITSDSERQSNGNGFFTMFRNGWTDQLACGFGTTGGYVRTTVADYAAGAQTYLLYRNGTQCATKNNDGAAFSAPTSLLVGTGYVAMNRNPLKGWISEVIMLDKRLPQADLDWLTAYLRAKYNI